MSKLTEALKKLNNSEKPDLIEVGDAKINRRKQAEYKVASTLNFLFTPTEPEGVKNLLDAWVIKDDDRYRQRVIAQIQENYKDILQLEQKGDFANLNSAPGVRNISKVYFDHAITLLEKHEFDNTILNNITVKIDNDEKEYKETKLTSEQKTEVEIKVPPPDQTQIIRDAMQEADSFIKLKQFSDAEIILKPLAAKNIPQVQFKLSYMYHEQIKHHEENSYRDMNRADAKTWLENTLQKTSSLIQSAANQNYIPALLKLSQMYLNGEKLLNIPQDFNKAIEYFEISSKLGSVEAYSTLAKMYSGLVNVGTLKKNPKKAAEYARLAHEAFQWDVQDLSRNDLGNLYKHMLEKYPNNKYIILNAALFSSRHPDLEEFSFIQKFNEWLKPKIQYLSDLFLLTCADIPWFYLSVIFDSKVFADVLYSKIIEVLAFQLRELAEVTQIPKDILFNMYYSADECYLNDVKKELAKITEQKQSLPEKYKYQSSLFETSKPTTSIVSNKDPLGTWLEELRDESASSNEDFVTEIAKSRNLTLLNFALNKYKPNISHTYLYALANAHQEVRKRGSWNDAAKGYVQGDNSEQVRYCIYQGANIGLIVEEYARIGNHDKVKEYASLGIGYMPIIKGYLVGGFNELSEKYKKLDDKRYEIRSYYSSTITAVDMDFVSLKFRLNVNLSQECLTNNVNVINSVIVNVARQYSDIFQQIINHKSNSRLTDQERSQLFWRALGEGNYNLALEQVIKFSQKNYMKAFSNLQDTIRLYENRIHSRAFNNLKTEDDIKKLLQVIKNDSNNYNFTVYQELLKDIATVESLGTTPMSEADLRININSSQIEFILKEDYNPNDLANFLLELETRFIQIGLQPGNVAKNDIGVSEFFSISQKTSKGKESFYDYVVQGDLWNSDFYRFLKNKIDNSPLRYINNFSLSQLTLKPQNELAVIAKQSDFWNECQKLYEIMIAIKYDCFKALKVQLKNIMNEKDLPKDLKGIKNHMDLLKNVETKDEDQSEVIKIIARMVTDIGINNEIRLQQISQIISLTSQLIKNPTIENQKNYYLSITGMAEKVSLPCVGELLNLRDKAIEFSRSTEAKTWLLVEKLNIQTPQITPASPKPSR